MRSVDTYLESTILPMINAQYPTVYLNRRVIYEL